MLSTQTMHRQTSALAVGAPAGARTRVLSGSWSAAAGYRREIGTGSGFGLGAGTPVAPFAGVNFAKKTFDNNNKIRPLSPKRRRTG